MARIPKPEHVAIAQDHAQYGVEVNFIDELSSNTEVWRAQLDIKPDDFVVCGYMGSLPGKDPTHGQLAFELAKGLDKIGAIPLNGGGNWVGDEPQPGVTSLMGLWAAGAKNGRIVHLDHLLTIEGLPKKPVKVACLIQSAGEERIAARELGLLHARDMGFVLPGGVGTNSEMLTDFCNMSVRAAGSGAARKNHNTTCIIDLPVNTADGSIRGFFHHQIEQLRVCHGAGFMRSYKGIDDHTLVYRPHYNQSVDGMRADLISIAAMCRLRASDISPEFFGPMHPQTKRYVRPIRGHLSCLFDPIEQTGWKSYFEKIRPEKDYGPPATTVHLSPK